MPIRPVLDVEIDPSDKLGTYIAKFNSFKKALEETPGIWSAAHIEADGIAERTQTGMAHYLTMLDLAKRLKNDNREAGKEGENSLIRMVDLTRSLSSGLEGGTAALLRMGGAATGVAAGIAVAVVAAAAAAKAVYSKVTTLAPIVGEGRKSALGLGLTYGEQKAFGTEFGRLVQPDSLLSGVSGALGDVSERASLYKAGLTPGEMRGSTAQVAAAVLRHAKIMANRFPEQMLGQLGQNFGFYDLGLNLEDLRRIRRTPTDEQNGYQSQFQKMALAFGIQDEAQKKWQDLDVKLKETKAKIETGQIKATTPLTPAVGGFAGFWGDLTLGFGNAVESLSGWVANPTLKNSLIGLADNVKAASDRIGAANAKPGTGGAHPFITIGSNADPNSKIDWNLKDFWNWMVPSNRIGGARGGAEHYPTSLLDLVAQLEHSGDNSVSKAQGAGHGGAIGRFQIMPATGALYGVKDPSALFDPRTNEAVAAKVLADLQKRYGKNLDEILVGYNASSAVRDRFVRSGDNRAVLPPETRAYLEHKDRLLAMQPKPVTVNVVVHNKTGANIAVNASQMPQ